MEWRVLLVLLFAVSFSFALPTGQLDTEENEDQDFADFEDAQEELEDFPDVEEEQEDYPGCKDSKAKYWCIAQKYRCSSYDVYKYCKRTCKRCPRDGNWSPYGPYSKCTKPCGGGKQYRSRTCSKPSPAYGGKKCPGLPKQSRDCNKQHCPVHGGWSPWGNWGTCSVTCGEGSQSRSRTCTNPAPAYGGKGCEGKKEETRDCNDKPCPINGGWSEWGNWGKCSVICGVASQSRSRICGSPAPQQGGPDCQGPTKQTRDCNTQPCPVDGGWSKWGDYGKCSVTCEGGSQSRSRTCTIPAPAHGGKDCDGKKEETRGCNTNPCPVDGGWSKWGDYGKCSVTCGGGSQSRSRTCTNPAPAHGGKDCDGKKEEEETRGCNTNPCPVPGGWSSWGPWSKCSRTCGSGGSQSRKRSCTNPPPAYGGKPCKEEDKSETRKCPVKYVPCPKPCHDIKSYYYCSGIAKKYQCGKYYKYCRKTCKKCYRG